MIINKFTENLFYFIIYILTAKGSSTFEEFTEFSTSLIIIDILLPFRLYIACVKSYRDEKLYLVNATKIGFITSLHIMTLEGE